MSAALLNTTIADPVLRERLEKLFWAKVDKRGHDECWPWTAKSVISSLKYGALNIRGVVTGAHRVAFALANGGIEDGAVIRHSCDNPPCCNPKHLLSGTQGENHRDMMERGRYVSVFKDPEVLKRAQETRRQKPRRLSEGEKQVKRELMQARWSDPAWRARFSALTSGENHPFYGMRRPRKPEVTERIVAARKANRYRHSAGTKEKMRLAALEREARRREQKS